MRMRTLLGTFVPCVLVATAAGCGSGGSERASLSQLPSAGTRSQVRQTLQSFIDSMPNVAPAVRARMHLQRHHLGGPGWLSAAARAKTAAKLYVANNYNDSIGIYNGNLQGGSPIGTITNGVSGPEGLAVDAAGKLYVSNAYNSTVTVYQPGQTSPSTTYSKNLTFPVAVAVDTAGTVYVANATGFSFAPGSIVEYPKGSTNPSLTITDANFQVVESVGLDASNNLYVTYMNPNETGQINEYAPGQSSGKNLNISLGFAGGITLDSAKNLLVTDQSLPAIEVFPPGQTNPSKTFGTTNATVALAFNHPGKKLFAADVSANQIDVYTYPAATLYTTFTTGVEAPMGVALSPTHV
ncbi:MAG: hypothetical protein ABI346_09150 [Candidatus Baltobacteraceae bacterium]